MLTVCDNAKDNCPVFFGKATRLHHNFNDPAGVTGSEEKRLAASPQVRDELHSYLRSFQSVMMSYEAKRNFECTDFAAAKRLSLNESVGRRCQQTRTSYTSETRVWTPFGLH